MQLKYVGAMPVVSQNGVGFDHTKPDKYTFLNAAIELLEALSFGATTTTKHLYNVTGREYEGDELLSLLKKFYPDLDAALSSRDEKCNHLVEGLITRVHENTNINEDEKVAWLNNIELMNEYYHQFITNEEAYQCALEALGQEIHDARITEVAFPLFRNYGLVLHDLDYVMQNRKSPIDSKLTIETGNEGLIGKLIITHR
ncbi:MAG TPA: hypothetical protein EYO73_04330 [Sulfurimonas sp.]|nr:hypothetical protein [Sulfurimonas sp.]